MSAIPSPPQSETFDRPTSVERPSAVHDAARLAAVTATGLLDTGPEAAFDRITRLAVAVLNVPVACVNVVDSTRSFWKSCVGVDSVPHRQLPVEDSFCQYVVNADQPLIVDDARLHETTRSNPAIMTMGVIAWAGFPLRSVDEYVVGTFCVLDFVPREWSAAEMETLRALALAVEGEIRLRTLLEDSAAISAALRREMDVRERLATLAYALVQADTTDAVSAAISEHAPTVLAAHVAAVATLDVELRQLRVRVPILIHGYTAGDHHTVALNSVTPLTDAVNNGEAIYIADHDSLQPRYERLADEARQIGASASAAVPLRRSDNTIIGALGIGWAQRQKFSASETALITTVALMCAQSLERAQLGDVRAELVQSLQHQLLPAIPQIDGVTAAVRYIPSNHGLGFGGDWYDIIDLDDGRAGIVIGDIAGHGIQAAANMAQTRGAINALTRLNADDLASIFDSAETILRHIDDDYIATVAVYVLDPATGALTYVSAGHPPGIIVNTDGAHQILDGGRRPLLGQRGPRPTVATAQLGPGSTLIACTDGLIEDRTMTLDDGVDRLVAAALISADSPLQQSTLDRIVNDLLQGRAVTDDTAIVAVQRTRP